MKEYAGSSSETGLAALNARSAGRNLLADNVLN